MSCKAEHAACIEHIYLTFLPPALPVEGAVLDGFVEATVVFSLSKKISESAESGVWDSPEGRRKNVRKMEMKPTFMPGSCHEFGPGVSLANPAQPKTLKIFHLAPKLHLGTHLLRQLHCRFQRVPSMRCVII